jgi:ribonuclease Z
MPPIWPILYRKSPETYRQAHCSARHLHGPGRALPPQGPSVGYVVGDGRRTLFAYVGDTHASALAEADWLDGVPVVITECTFLDDAERERAARIGHTVWSELRPIVEARPETLFVLIHFSLRHCDTEVVDFFAAADLPNIVVWAGTDGLLPQQNGI